MFGPGLVELGFELQFGSGALCSQPIVEILSMVLGDLLQKRLGASHARESFSSSWRRVPCELFVPKIFTVLSGGLERGRLLLVGLTEKIL